MRLLVRLLFTEKVPLLKANPLPKKSNGPPRMLQVPTGSVITTTHTNNNIGIDVELDASDGVFLVVTNGVSNTIGIDGMFNITFTCSATTPITFDFDETASQESVGLGGGFVKQQTVTITSKGPICCPISCAFCVYCKVNTEFCCGQTCPF
jgi:hypothetical protein